MLVPTKRKQNGNIGTRVKVAVRCRPPFQDEIDFAKGDFFSIVDTKEEDANKNTLGRISLTMISGKQRDFYFDYVFGETTAQDQVYDRLARPVVADVLKGCNGTIFAYGQTGTGKTYTMGILEFVRNEHAGLIPRAIAQIFDYVDQSEGRIDMTISLSFLQLYRETIQDLLSQASGNTSPTAEENLLIREDPIRGFYVEGLQEFVVRSYLEAEALINLGLENRAIAPTMMNSTSSRSHTVLTINIEQRVQGDQQNYTKTLRSKLLMVDLAGSERVRRTISKGTRLSEAKSINTSLSALGNVIAALAESNSAHIPYRDSKLTRLLQDSLGGTAATALIATIGPAAINYGETLSTLLFAQRCMAVKVTPIPHEEVDYAEMCAKLQAQINDLQGSMSEKLSEQQSQYEKTIFELQNQLEDERAKAQQSALVTTVGANSMGISLDEHQGIFHEELRLMMDAIERLRNQDPMVTEAVEHSWFLKPNDWSAMNNDYDRLPNGPLVSVLAFAYEMLRSMYLQMRQVLRENQQRDDLARAEMVMLLETEASLQQDRHWERQHMALSDPRYLDARQQPSDKNRKDNVGSHLTPIQRYEAMKKVDQHFRGNNFPVSKYDRVPVLVSSNEEDDTMRDPVLKMFHERPTIFQYENLDHFVESLTFLHQQMSQDLIAVNVLMARKDVHFKSLKEELTTQIVDRRKREEEVVNWSYILKYLLKSTSKLRKELQAEKRVNTQLFPHHHHAQSVQMTPKNERRELQNISSAASNVSEHSDLTSTPDTVNFLTNFLRQNPPSSSSSSVSSRSNRLNSNESTTGSAGGDEESTGINRSNTNRPIERPMSMSHQPFSNVEQSNFRGKGRNSDNNENTRFSSQQHQPQFETEEEQDAYDDALQRVQYRAKTNPNPTTANLPTYPKSNMLQNHGRHHRHDDQDEDISTDYSSLPSASSSRSYRSNISTQHGNIPQLSLNNHNNGNNNAVNRKVSSNESFFQEPVLTSSSIVTGKDGRPIIVTSPPQQQKRSSAPTTTSSSTSSGYRSDHSSSSAGYVNDFQPIDISKPASGHGPSATGGIGAGATGNSEHAVGKTLAKNRAKRELAQGPSEFAQEVAKSLGVQGAQARDAMAIIDQIASISAEQLQQLDLTTRQEILQLRQELGIDKFLRQQQQPSSENTQLTSADLWQQRANVAEQQHIGRARTFSGGFSSVASSTVHTPSSTTNASRSSSRGRSISSSRNNGSNSATSSPLRGISQNGLLNSTDGSQSRSSSRGSTRGGGSVKFNNILSQETRPVSASRTGNSSDKNSALTNNGNSRSRGNTPSQHSAASSSTVTTQNNNNSNYLRQHNVYQQPQGTPAAFVNLSDMQPSSSSRNNSQQRYPANNNVGKGRSNSTSSEQSYGYGYDDDGYYSGVADSSISSRNSYFMQVPSSTPSSEVPPPPPPRPATLMSNNMHSNNSRIPIPTALSTSNHHQHLHHQQQQQPYPHRIGRPSGYGSISSRGSHYTEDDDNDDEFSQLDSMG